MCIIFMAFVISVLTAWFLLMLLVLRSTVKMKVAAAFVGMLVCFVVNMWAILLFDDKRKAGYVWRD